MFIKHANDQLTKSWQANTHNAYKHQSKAEQSTTKNETKSIENYVIIMHTIKFTRLIVVLNEGTAANIKCD